VEEKAETGDVQGEVTLDRYLSLGEKSIRGFLVIKGVANGSQADTKGIRTGDIPIDIDVVSVACLEVNSVQH